LDSLYVQTPILESTPLSKEIGVPVYLKMEALQPCGSFKNRGAAILLSDFAARGKRDFVTASWGNAGLCLAYCCRMLGCSLKVIVPLQTSSLMKGKIEQEGAELILFGNDFEEAKNKAKEIALAEEITYVDPHDHPLITEGISTLVYEIFGAGLKPAAIVLPVGYGELLAGVVQGLIACKWKDIPIITAETESSCPFATALFTDEKHAKGIIPKLFLSLENVTIYPQIVTEKAAFHAAHRFADDTRVLIEPESAAALALVYQNLPLLKTFSSILVIVSGGSNVTLSSFSS